jgi:thymidylate synthase
MLNSYKNANEAYESLLDYVIQDGIDFDNTKALFNCGFYIQNPLDNHITNKERNWKLEYAEAEWQWYLSGDPSIDKLGEIYGKVPPIWEKMADSDRNVNSNYGYQWNRNDQIHYVVGKLREHPNTRHAAISIYDCKEFDKYRNDTPCTYAVQFTIINNKLNMSVYMRSNDVWFGFCNDQYQFSSLQKMIAERLSIDVGWYYHHAHNMHLYNDKL